MHIIIPIKAKTGKRIAGKAFSKRVSGAVMEIKCKARIHPVSCRLKEHLSRARRSSTVTGKRQCWLLREALPLA